MIDSSLLCESTYDVTENTAPAPHSSSSRRASLIETSPWARLFSSYEVTQENQKLESSDHNWGKKKYSIDYYQWVFFNTNGANATKNY